MASVPLTSGLRAVSPPRASKPRSPPSGRRGLSHPGSSQDSRPGLGAPVPPPGHPTFSLETNPGPSPTWRFQIVSRGP